MSDMITYSLSREAPVLIGLQPLKNHPITTLRSIPLMPGLNQIASNDWEEIKENSIVKSLLFEQQLEVFKDKKGKIFEVIDISKMPVAKALSFIAQTYSLPALQDWLRKESKGRRNNEIITAIREQMDGLNGKGNEN